MHRDRPDRQLTPNTPEVHMLVVLVSEVKTHPSRTAVIYTTLIKNALILDTQKAIPIYIFAKYTARQRQLTHSAPLHQGGINEAERELQSENIHTAKREHWSNHRKLTQGKKNCHIIHCIFIKHKESRRCVPTSSAATPKISFKLNYSHYTHVPME